jgi:hypothetical protein
VIEGCALTVMTVGPWPKPGEDAFSTPCTGTGGERRQVPKEGAPSLLENDYQNHYDDFRPDHEILQTLLSDLW